MLGIQCNASKDVLKEMFDRVAYTTTTIEYDGVMELRRYKQDMAVWV